MGSFWCFCQHVWSWGQPCTGWELEDNLLHSRLCGVWCPHLDCGSLLWGQETQACWDIRSWIGPGWGPGRPTGWLPWEAHRLLRKERHTRAGLLTHTIVAHTKHKWCKNTQVQWRAGWLKCCSDLILLQWTDAGPAGPYNLGGFTRHSSQWAVLAAWPLVPLRKSVLSHWPMHSSLREVACPCWRTPGASLWASHGSLPLIPPGNFPVTETFSTIVSAGLHGSGGGAACISGDTGPLGDIGVGQPEWGIPLPFQVKLCKLNLLLEGERQRGKWSCSLLDYPVGSFYIHTHTQMHTHIYIHTCIHTNIHIHTEIHTHIYTHTHTYTQIHRYTHIHAYTYTYTYTCTHTHTEFL